MVEVGKMKGFFSSAIRASHLDDDLQKRFGMRTNFIAKKLATYYKTDAHRDGVLGQLKNFINSINTDSQLSDDKIFDAIVHAYLTKNSQYPENFDTYIAMQYLKKGKNNKSTSDSKRTEWFSLKINEVEKHLD